MSKDMIQQLKKERESFEKEKTESKDLVNMLEARLKQMTSVISLNIISFTWSNFLDTVTF